jgi:hypothetical protein
MAVNQTSFTPGKRPAGRGKGTKNKRTELRESIGINTWDQIEDYLVNEGAEKLISSMRELRPGQFVYAYTGLLEYFRPKLSRQQLSAAPGEGEVIVTMNLNSP